MSNSPEQLTVGVENFRRNSPGLLARVEAGSAEITLTSNGRKVARLVRLSEEERLAGNRKLMASAKALGIEVAT